MSQTVPVKFSVKSFTGPEGLPLNDLNCTITISPAPETLLQTDGTNVITGQPLIFPHVPGGITTNLWPGNYRVAISGIAKAWNISVPQGTTTGPLMAAQLAAGLTTFTYTNVPPGVWSVTAGSTNVHVSSAVGAVTISVDGGSSALPAGTLLLKLGPNQDSYLELKL
jgi:hypothetical protein